MTSKILWTTQGPEDAAESQTPPTAIHPDLAAELG